LQEIGGYVLAAWSAGKPEGTRRERMPPLPPELQALGHDSRPMLSISVRVPYEQLHEIHRLCQLIGTDRAAVVRALLSRALSQIELNRTEAAPTPVSIS
jgi:hypothetical protein